MKWSTAWQIVKDVLLTGTGLGLIVSQVFAMHPSDILLVTGLALTVPSAASHATALLSGAVPGPGSSSDSSHAHGEPGSPSRSSPPPGTPGG